MARYLITGATGLIGSHLLPLFAPQDTLYLLGRTEPDVSGVPASTEFIQADLSTCWDAVSLPAQLDAVIHLAQSPHYREFPEKSQDMLALNTTAAIKLVEHARKCSARFLYASSGGVYGSGKDGFLEHDKLQPASELGFYLGTKLCTELLLENYFSVMDVTVVRFFFVYGKGQRTTALIPRLVDAVKTGKPVTLTGKDGISINPIHAYDAAQALHSCLHKPGSRKLNIAGADILSMRQVAHAIGDFVGNEPVFETQPASGHANCIGDISAMTELVGAPETSFAQGLMKSF